MSKEIKVAPWALAVKFNGVFSPTDRGHLANELVRVDRTLRGHADPKIPFSMSEDQKLKCIVRREELCGLLGLPPDEEIRKKKIRGLNRSLRRVGFPYYRVNVR